MSATTCGSAKDDESVVARLPAAAMPALRARDRPREVRRKVAFAPHRETVPPPTRAREERCYGTVKKVEEAWCIVTFCPNKGPPVLAPGKDSHGYHLCRLHRERFGMPKEPS